MTIYPEAYKASVDRCDICPKTAWLFRLTIEGVPQRVCSTCYDAWAEKPPPTKLYPYTITTQIVVEATTMANACRELGRLLAPLGTDVAVKEITMPDEAPYS